MPNITDLLKTIILLGAVNGLVLTILLYILKKRRQTNRLLAGIILLLSMACFNIHWLEAEWLNSTQLLRIIADVFPMIMIMPLGPLVWLYTQSSLDLQFRITRWHRLHFLPVVIDLVPSVVLLITDIIMMTGTMSKPTRLWISDTLDYYHMYADVPRWLSLVLYTALAWRYWQKANRSAEAWGISLAWTKQLLQLFTGFSALWLLYLIPYIIPATSDALLDAVGWYPLFIPLAVLVYWIGIKGYLVAHQTMYQPLKQEKSVMQAAAIELPQDTIHQVVQLLTTSMSRDKLYLHPELNVNALAQHIGMPPKTVSAVLNQHLDKSFSAFINEYRVEEFKNKIVQAEARQLTITGLARECGFSSTATFQRIFRQVTGMSPTQYLQQASALGGSKVNTAQIRI